MHNITQVKTRVCLLVVNQLCYSRWLNCCAICLL